MYKRLVSVLYALNIIIQAILTLVTPAGLMLLIAWLFVSKASAPTWLYAILIPIGFMLGLISMIKFVISAAEGLERLEKQNRKNGRK